MAKMINCKHCGSEISSTAKTCPQCGGKNSKPIFKKWWFWLIIVVVVGGVAAGGSGGSSESSSNNNSSSSVGSTNTDDKKEEPTISYTSYTVDEMMDDLDSNALKASQKYKDQYVKITGTLSTIDSGGKYISLLPSNDEWAFIGVSCYIKNEDQLNKVMEMNTGDKVTLKGKITDVGEILGYSLDIEEIN